MLPRLASSSGRALRPCRVLCSAQGSRATYAAGGTASVLLPFTRRLQSVGVQHARTLMMGTSASGSSSTVSVSSLKRLRQLEDSANRAPGDAARQHALMMACNENGQARVTIRRYESGAYAEDEAVYREYIRALALTNQLGRMPMAQLGFTARDGSGGSYGGHAGGLGGNYGASGGLGHGAAMGQPQGAAHMLYGGSAGSNGSAPAGTPEAPIHVQYTESTRVQMLRLLQRLAVFGLLAGGLVMFLDEKGMPKGLGLANEVQPVVGSPKRFADVVGVDEAKEDLVDIVKYLRQPKTFTRLGGKLPKGCLLTGPPGTGKTLLARAVAGEAGVPFFYMSGSEFEEVFVGVGAKRVRELFSAAKKRAPCIIFIDEIDAIGSHRNPKEQQAMKMTLNQLLVEMDGFQQNAGVIVLAATNFPESLDRALVRPGRFDTRVTVPLPDVRGRRQILDLYAKPVPLEESADLEQIARATPGFSGADLSNLINVAALRASHEEKKQVEMSDLEWACDKIRMGAERKSAHISPENQKLTAYHEGGHALVALKTKGAMPIHKATIMPRGEALGMVSYLPERDQLNLSRQQMLAHIDVCMGGRVAEELIFGHDDVTTGASSDLQQATQTARNMVTKYGMSESLGPLFHDRGELENLSPATREAIEAEVKSYVQRGEANARRILTAHKEELHRLAKGLLEHETLSREEINELLAGRKIRQGAEHKASTSAKSAVSGAAASGKARAKGGAAVPATASGREPVAQA